MIGFWKHILFVSSCFLRETCTGTQYLPSIEENLTVCAFRLFDTLSTKKTPSASLCDKNVSKSSLFFPCVFVFLFSIPVMSAGMEKPGVVEQVDLTPTLALGLGLPISQNSVGCVIPSVLEETSLRDQLRFLHLNGHQLSCLLKDSIPNYEKGRLQIHCEQPLHLLKAHKAESLSDLSLIIVLDCFQPDCVPCTQQT